MALIVPLPSVLGPRRSSSCELLVASRRMISYGKAYWRFAGAPMAIGSQAEGSGGLRGTLSAEMYAVALAMHICGKVPLPSLPSLLHLQGPPPP